LGRIDRLGDNQVANLDTQVDNQKLVWNVRPANTYRAFHRFGQAKFPDGGSVLVSNQYSILPQLPSKILLDSKVVKVDLKIIISVC